jgi:hypothetical protein
MGLQIAIVDEKQYWLVYHSTVRLIEVAHSLLRAGFRLQTTLDYILMRYILMGRYYCR